MSNKPQLFGTDGVRGVAGHYPLDHATIWKLGGAIGRVLGDERAPRAGQVLLGEDTRESSAWISRTLAAGLQASGLAVTYAGVITTPGVAFLTRHHGYVAGIVVSASHNPLEDNGIKVLASTGRKLAEAVELAIERELAETDGAPAESATAHLVPSTAILGDYLDYLVDLAGDL